MAECPFCYGEDDSPPKAPVVAMGTRAYLSCTIAEELMNGHCLIVPIQHHLNMLEADDDVWDEVRVRCALLSLITLAQLWSVELHEVSYAHVRRRRSGRHLLRNGHFAQVAEAHNH